MKNLLLVFSLFLCACSEEEFKGYYEDVKGRKEVACPDQSAQTLVLYAFGQSNSANALAKQYKNSDPRIINYFKGKCYIAEDPLLGPTGDKGTQWVVTAQKLMARGSYDHIIINSFGVGGSAVAQWIEGGNLVSRYNQQMPTIYTPTYFLWHQGESEAQMGVSQSDYQSRMNILINKSLQNYPSAKFYVSLATVCKNAPNETIRAAQRALVDNVRVFQGPDTDGITDRYDGCHFGANAQEEISDLWLTIL